MNKHELKIDHAVSGVLRTTQKRSRVSRDAFIEAGIVLLNKMRFADLKISDLAQVALAIILKTDASNNVKIVQSFCGLDDLGDGRPVLVDLVGGQHHGMIHFVESHRFLELFQTFLHGHNLALVVIV